MMIRKASDAFRGNYNCIIWERHELSESDIEKVRLEAYRYKHYIIGTTQGLLFFSVNSLSQIIIEANHLLPWDV